MGYQSIMNMEEAWKDQYKKWKFLEPYQVKLLDDGPKSLSQSWLVNSMWCEWMDMKKIKDTELPPIEISPEEDPWFDK